MTAFRRTGDFRRERSERPLAALRVADAADASKLRADAANDCKVPQSRPSLGLAELPRENFPRMRDPFWGQAQRFRLVFGIKNQAFLEKPVGDGPIDSLPDLIAVMQRQAKDRESRIIDLVSVECHLPLVFLCLPAFRTAAAHHA